MHFYKTMKDLNHLIAKDFRISDHICSKDRNEQREDFRTRLYEEIGERAQRANEEHFRDINNIEPIYVYTNEGIHPNEVNIANKSEPVYKVVNRFLREHCLLTKT